jgi:predicted DNA-binding transcriptional regulator YafY
VRKLERLLNLTAALLDAVRPLTAEEIHQRVPGYPGALPSFRRQFERDKDALRSLGIPLRNEEIPYSDPPTDGYRIHKQEYRLRDPDLEPDELAALHLAASLIRLTNVEGAEAFWKLGGTARTDASAGAAVDLDTPDVVPTLFGALTDRHPVAFTYRGAPRVVEPVGLHFGRGRWYLQGHDRTRDALRSFRLDRLESPVTVDVAHRFPARPPAAAVPWEAGEDAPRTATVHVDAHQAGLAVRLLGPEAVREERPDGSVVLAIEVTHVPSFRSFVLGLLDHAEVLDPPDLRAEVVEWLERIERGQVA